MGALMQIGDVANETGLSVDTIRFYERQSLLQRAARSSGGFRLFSQGDVTDLTFIRNAQELSFSLQEIRDLVGLRKTRQPNCSRVEKILDRKIASVRAKITALRKLEKELTRTLQHCQANLRRVADGNADSCPALNDISQSNERKRR